MSTVTPVAPSTLTAPAVVNAEADLSAAVTAYAAASPTADQKWDMLRSLNVALVSWSVADFTRRLTRDFPEVTAPSSSLMSQRTAPWKLTKALELDPTESRDVVLAFYAVTQGNKMGMASSERKELVEYALTLPLDQRADYIVTSLAIRAESIRQGILNPAPVAEVTAEPTGEAGEPAPEVDAAGVVLSSADVAAAAVIAAIVALNTALIADVSPELRAELAGEVSALHAILTPPVVAAPRKRAAAKVSA